MAKYVSILSLLLLVAIGAHFAGIFAADRRLATADIYEEAKLAWRSYRQVDGAETNPLLPQTEFRRAGHPDRFLELDPSGPPIVVPGGFGAFSDICGKRGCLAVAFTRDGSVAWSIPFAAKLLDHKPLVAGERSYAGSDAATDTYGSGIRTFANGDILLTPNLANGFPYSVGLTRIALDGTVRWTRTDHGNHRATIAADGTIYTPQHQLRSDYDYSRVPHVVRPSVTCRLPKTQYADFVQVLSEDGVEKRTIDLVALFTRDPAFGPLLSRTLDPCDPLHLNSVDVANRADAATADGVEAGDLIVSLRALSAVAIVAADGSRIKRVISGSFAVQHSAHFLGNGEIVIFDNMGGAPGLLPSRVLAIDLDTGAERTVYANGAFKSDNMAELSPTAGDIALSPDRTRALVSFTRSGRMVELEMPSGKVLSRYDNTFFRENVPQGVFKLYAAAYAQDRTGPTRQ